MSRFERVACWSARAAGVGLAALGALELHAAFRLGAFHALLALLLLAVSLGSWFLHPLALRVATVVLLLVAVILPLGMINPFHASEPGPKGSHFVATTVAIAIGGCLICVVLAYLVSQARLAVVRHRRR